MIDIKLPINWEELSQIATCFSTLAIIMAAWQLWQDKRVSTATLIVELNNQFDNESMVASRHILRKQCEEAKKAVDQGHKDDGNHYTDANALERDIPSHYFEIMKKLDAEKSEDYRHLMNLCWFMETIGAMARRGYIPIDDLLDLYLQPAYDVYLFIHMWVEHKEKEPLVKKGLFENALWLGKHAKFASRRNLFFKFLFKNVFIYRFVINLKARA